MGRIRLLAWSGLLVITAVALARNLPTLSSGMRDWAEPGNVAAALVEGRGFSDPFDGGTGPTAWVSPLPVLVEASVFFAFGVKSAASAKVLLVLSILGLAAANALILSALAPLGAWARCGASAAFLLYCAFVPAGPLQVLSEAWLDILLSCVLLWSVLGVSGNPRGRAAWVLVATAFLAPLDNAGLAVSVGLVILALCWSLRRGRGSLGLPLAAAAAAVLAVATWTARNAVTLGRFVPLKSNSWFELNLANVASADGLPRMETVLRSLPYFDQAQFALYSGMGETRYVDQFKAPALAALRADPLHFIGNILRRAGDAAVFCRREGGGAFTRAAFAPGDAARLSQAGELIVAGKTGAFWTRIDAPPERERALIASLHLGDGEGAWRDWSEKRLDYDAQFRGFEGVAAGYLTAGLPVAALLVCVLLSGGRLPPPAGWAAAIGFGMLLPYVLVNHNERHQLPLFAMQAVAVGCCLQAIVGRAGKAAQP